MGDKLNESQIFIPNNKHIHTNIQNKTASQKLKENLTTEQVTDLRLLPTFAGVVREEFVRKLASRKS